MDQAPPEFSSSLFPSFFEEVLLVGNVEKVEVCVDALALLRECAHPVSSEQPRPREVAPLMTHFLLLAIARFAATFPATFL